MRGELTRAQLLVLVRELGKTAPKGSYRVYLVGGSSAVYEGWRASSIDADLFADEDRVFRDIQGIKRRLDVNVEFARPEDFVPELKGSKERHVFLEKVGPIHLHHYDPYAQTLAKIVRGFARDLDDARHFLASGMVDADRLRSLVRAIPAAAYAKYPRLSRDAVLEAVDAFLADAER